MKDDSMKDDLLKDDLMKDDLMKDDLLTRLAPLTSRINEMMELTLKADGDFFGEMGIYNFQAGGKRLRPIIFCLSYQAVGGELDEDCIKVATAFEYLHMATLMHDDIIDLADTRRNQPASHHIFGIPETVLAGDYFLAKAALMCVSKKNMDAAIVLVEVIRDLTLGELNELKAKNNVDLSKQEYMRIIFQKTAALMQGASKVAAILVEGDEKLQQALGMYGQCMGLAFQIMDDILDYTAQKKRLGKPVMQDLAEGRITLPFIMARESLAASDAERLRELGKKFDLTDQERLEANFLVKQAGGIELSLKEAELLAQQAIDALTALPDTLHRRLLGSIAAYTVTRDY
ncbi:MAG: polyprenyl synthetase family protein [Deltaproteobacteria bacterium]|jgi:octaprenyl-diphosphate synthase|nr:polyprenyl synthetase family protein [Deltaproteobacteria bacterium]